VPAREGEKHLPGVQPLPSRQAETQLRGVQSLPPRQAETRLQGVQLLPSRQAEKRLRGVQLLPSRQVETELRGVQSGTRGSAEFKAGQTRARERVDDGSYKNTSTMMEYYNVHQHYTVHTKKRLHYNVLLVNIFSCDSI
jgi:hypothetical protein